MGHKPIRFMYRYRLFERRQGNYYSKYYFGKEIHIVQNKLYLRTDLDGCHTGYEEKTFFSGSDGILPLLRLCRRRVWYRIHDFIIRPGTYSGSASTHSNYVGYANWILLF